jgi:hypothetical protein
VRNEPFRRGAFEIPCRPDRGLAVARGRDRRPLDAMFAWMQRKPSEALGRLVVFLSRLWADVRAWVRSVNDEVVASLTRIRAHAKQ